MSGSCCNEEQLELEVGKTYRSSFGNLYIKITRRWNVNIFEGECDGEPYLFSSCGTVLGYPCFSGNSTEFWWHLEEIPPEPKYEIALCSNYSDFNNIDWCPIHYFKGDYENGLYLVREKDKFKTTKIYTPSEFREFRKNKNLLTFLED